MSKLAIRKGTTGKLVEVFIGDATQANGAGLTGLVFNTSGLTAYYYREGASAPVQITLATMTLGTWASGGFKEVSAANMPGLYSIGLPNAAIASGADSVKVLLKGAANMVVAGLEIQLTDVDFHDATAMGVTSLLEGYGLLGKYSVLRNTTYSGANLATYDVRLYTSAANAVTDDGVTGLIASFSVVNSFDVNGNLTKSRMVRN